MVNILDNRLMLQRVLSVLVIIFGFEWFNIVEILLGKYLDVFTIMSIGTLSLPITILIVILGLTIFDKSFSDQIKRPKGATLIGLLFIWGSASIFKIPQPIRWSEPVFFWNIELQGAIALIPILILFALSLYIGLGLLRLSIWAWRLCFIFVLYSIAEYIIQQIKFVKSGGIEAMNAAFNVDAAVNNLGLKMHKETVIWSLFLFVLLALYLIVIKGAFNKAENIP